MANRDSKDQKCSSQSCDESHIDTLLQVQVS